MASHKNAIVTGTEALEKWAEANNTEALTRPDWAAFRDALNTLNPEIHECEVDSCLVETWKGASDNCPACGSLGRPQGRMVFNYTPKNPRTPRHDDEESQQDDGPPSM